MLVKNAISNLLEKFGIFYLHVKNVVEYVKEPFVFYHLIPVLDLQQHCSLLWYNVLHAAACEYVRDGDRKAVFFCVCCV